MPITPPRLDDRGFDDLVAELIARIPAHTPEWTHAREGDPGRTLLDLFAWLGDTLLYRANLIPERQRLAFLRLLGEQVRPAVAARGLVTVTLDEPDAAGPVTLAPLARISGPVVFETLSELTVLPVTAEAYYKRRLGEPERARLSGLLDDLTRLYELDEKAVPNVTTPAFAGDAPIPGGLDLVADALDRSLWLALLAADPAGVESARDALGGTPDGRQRVASVGIMPQVDVPALFEDAGARGRIPHVWEISTGREVDDQPEYVTLEQVEDSSDGLSRRGVQHLVLPGRGEIGATSNDVRTALDAGVGNRPPRLDDPDRAARLVCWLRLRPTATVHRMSLSWVGLNAVEVDQRETVTGRVLGQSDGAPDQVFRLPGASVEPSSFELQVEEAGRGYVGWQGMDRLATAGREDAVYELDAEAGTVTFGDGVRGRVPDRGMRVRVARMRAGGGAAGNLPPGSLRRIEALGTDGRRIESNLKVVQPLTTDGGEDAESLVAAERRIPAALRHRERAVTPDDYRDLAVETPGVRLGRVEVLPRFLPHQRRNDVPGVVSVMVLPRKELQLPPNPRPDRILIEQVHAWLTGRRPLTTELYVIGCEYVDLSVSVGITIRNGFGRDQVTHDVREALRRYLWPLPPDGPHAEGWPLGRRVRDGELEVVVARVEGVGAVSGVRLFTRRDGAWRPVVGAGPGEPGQVDLRSWQLPQLQGVVVAVTDRGAPEDLGGVPAPFDGEPEGIAVPVVPEVC